MASAVQVIQAVPIPIVVVRVRTSIARWPTEFGASLDKIWTAARAGEIPKPGRNVMVYRHRPDGQVDIECGAEAPSGFVARAEIVGSTTPSGRAVTLAHIGDYRRLGESHARLSEWARANGHTLQPVSWEVYDHWRDNPETIRTDLFHLIE